MLDTLPLLNRLDFPPIKRRAFDTLQVNLTYECNQRCLHCHVNAGPTRTEAMTDEVIEDLYRVLNAHSVQTLDLTGGAPEMHPRFRDIVRHARTEGTEPGYEDLAAFLAENRVSVSASLPCYSRDNVDQQRGDGVFERSIQGLLQLNRLGYGAPDSGLELNLVYNPQGPSLPPPQAALQADYKSHLSEDFGIVFSQLFTITNQPIARFGSTLASRGQFNDYMQLLRDNFSAQNLPGLMCRNTISVDWRGYLYDCDFNQMLDLPLPLIASDRPHLSQLAEQTLEDNPIATRDHCFACTAGQGSSCGGVIS